MGTIESTARRRGLGVRSLVLVSMLVVVAAALFGGASAGASSRQAALDPVTVAVIPIANTRPLDVGIKQGFFERQNIEIKKVVLQSGNDIVLALANSKTNIGFAGWVPAMIARTNGVPITTITTSEVEGTSLADNWQNIIVKGSSSIREPSDLAGKTIAVNALKGVGEVMIRAALDKIGVDSSTVKLLPVPFPAMRSALSNGQVDAIWTPEPFLSQAINLDGARDLMAPGPVLGRYFPVGGYFARTDWVAGNPEVAARFRIAMNQSLKFAQENSAEVRALPPVLGPGVRLPIWTTTVDRAQLLKLAGYAKKYGAITSLPNFTQLVPSSIEGGKTLQGTVNDAFITLRQDGQIVSELRAGKYTLVVTDNSKTQNFRFVGPGVSKTTTVRGTGRTTWSVSLRKGEYKYSSATRPAAKRTVAVK